MTDVEQIINMLFIKNQLYTRTSEELEDAYLKDRTVYLLFLISLSTLFSEDPYSLLMVDGVTDKLYNIINSYRFKRKDIHEEVLTDMGNKTLLLLNTLKTIDDDTIKKYKYSQLKKRRMNQSAIEYLPRFISCDYVIIYLLEKEKLEDISLIEFLSGTYYLLNTYPSIYKENRKFISLSIEHIKNNIDKSDKNLGIISKKVIKKLRKNK